MTRRSELFCTWLDENPSSVRALSWGKLLPREEQARGTRYIFDRHKTQHVLAHGLKRLVLSRFYAVNPEDWEFEVGERGKPIIRAPIADIPIHFNLSHTDGLAVVLVSTGGGEVGVDVENVDRRVGGVQIAERFFAPAEVEVMRGLPLDQQRDYFFQIWTLKEAYIKARGLGLAIPLSSFWFTLAPPAPPAIQFAPPTEDSPARWRFFQAFVAPSFRIAAAIERIPGALEPELIVHEPDGELMRSLVTDSLRER
jgi:4'-phosphopantetheinyl transferase